MIQISNKYKYVSFDVFDTLIVRDVLSPIDVFKIVEINLKQKGISKIDNFVEKRILAQKKAIAQNNDSEEISLYHIYSNIPFDSKEERNKVYQEEINAENLVCKPNPELVNILPKLKEDGKKIIITSDMYLGKDVIAQILERFNIPYDFLFVSSNIGLRKSSGRLFKYILSSLRINKNEIIHIGDNFKSDYIAPKIVGISAIRYKRNKPLYIDSIKDIHNLSSNIIQAVKINGSGAHSDYYQIGYNYLGPLLVGFCHWLVSEMKHENMENPWFLARDGYIMQKAFKILYPSYTSDYVYVSRRSLTVPRLSKAKSWRDIINTVGYIKRNETWKDLLHKLGFYENETFSDKLKELYGENVSKEELLSGKYDNVLTSLIPTIYKIAEEENYEVKQYLDRLSKNSVIPLVDIGWYGTIQKSMRTLITSDKRIKGYYLGILEKEGYENIEAKGYIYDYHSHNNVFDEKLIYGFNGLIESFFTANHGSCKNYKEGSPILEEWESCNWNVINDIHNGALQFCSRIKSYLEYCNFDKKESFSDLNRLMTHPRREEISLLGKIVFFDTYYEQLIKHSGWYYIFHPKRILHDLTVSNWKIAFIKNIIQIDYADKIYKLIMKFK